MANNNMNRRGFAAMDENKRREISSRGGQSQGRQNNPRNFANLSPEERSEIASRGGQSRGNRINDEE